MGLNEDFQAAAAQVKNLKGSPAQDELLTLYGLFKQSEVGDVNTDKPGLFDLKGKAKWEAWNGRKGLSQDDAKQQYIDYVATLVTKYGV